MAEVFYLPQMGQTMVEGTILRWLKQEGEEVESWEAIVEMMTDKINMEVEPQIKGTIRKLLAAEGQTVPVGAPIAVIGAPDEDISALLANLGSGPAAPPPAAPGSAAGLSTALPAEPAPTSTSGEVPPVSPRARQVAREAGADWKSLSLSGTGFEGMVVERDVLAHLAATPPGETVRATPLAARIAADLGVPLADAEATGPGRRVTAGDVRRASVRRTAPLIQPRVIPLQGMRKVIAQRLVASAQQAVHVPLRADVDMSACAELRRQLKPALEAMRGRLTYTDLIAAAVVLALVDFPEMNATLEQDEIRIHDGVHLGIAVALEQGLTVPVIRRAERLRLPDLSAAIAVVAAGARGNTLPPDAYSGGTFTISNLGQFGVESFDPILNPPQVGILGCGAIRDRVVAVGGAPAVRPVMTLTLTFDHRATDGAPAAGLLARIRELLENPGRLLL